MEYIAIISYIYAWFWDDKFVVLMSFVQSFYIRRLQSVISRIYILTSVKVYYMSSCLVRYKIMEHSSVSELLVLVIRFFLELYVQVLYSESDIGYWFSWLYSKTYHILEILTWVILSRVFTSIIEIIFSFKSICVIFRLKVLILYYFLLDLWLITVVTFTEDILMLMWCWRVYGLVHCLLGFLVFHYDTG